MSGLKQNLSIYLGLRKNTNIKSAAYTKWFAEVVNREGLTQRALIEHIAGHVESVPKPLVAAVINQLSQCVPELMSQGVSVKLDGIGVFYPTVNSRGVSNPTSYNVATDVKGVRMRLRPDTSKFDDLSSANFKQKCSFEIAGVFQEVITRAPDPGTPGDKGERYYQLVDYDQWRAANA
jgi:nucleoid DNA-binding protein